MGSRLLMTPFICGAVRNPAEPGTARFGERSGGTSTSSTLYFNELDPFTAQWCRNAWPEAEVDDRSILDITRPVDAVRQHYFAGIGGWEYACELAGWPEHWPLWTGSCPCQPFSVAGKGQAAQDERDLWPAFFRLITLGKPPVI